MNIHETAIIAPSAQLGENVSVGAYSIIKENVIIGNGTSIGDHVVIDSDTEIGEGNRFFPFCSIGSIPQDLKFGGEASKVKIGDRNTIREFVSINKGTEHGGGITTLGSDNLLMAYVHVAHDCMLGSNIVMANAATLGGHITIGDHAIIGGLVAIHQFVRVGAYVIIGGCSAVAQDVLPFTSAVGNRAKLHGLNQIGLKRQGFSSEAINSLKKAYRILFRQHHKLSDAIKIIEKELSGTEVQTMLDFISSMDSKRGICSGKPSASEND